MQLELNLIFICFKLAYWVLIMIFGIDSQTGFQRSPSLSKKKIILRENK
jgi:hypothetical protein